MAPNIDQPVGTTELDEQELDRILSEVAASGPRSDADVLEANDAGTTTKTRPVPSVVVSPDRMTAYLTLAPVPGGYTEVDARSQLYALRANLQGFKTGPFLTPVLEEAWLS